MKNKKQRDIIDIAKKLLKSTEKEVREIKVIVIPPSNIKFLKKKK